MGLKQSVVIVSEFSVPLPGGTGSRGATPGDYVTRYMARGEATEPLAPIRHRSTDDAGTRYLARESTVARPGISRDAAMTAMRKARGSAGVAFGYGSVSLSDDQLKAAARDIQNGFDNGKTVLKTVLSFDEGYLRDRGVVGQNFRCERRGDYRGHLDQMKLRMAVMHGLERMSSGNSGFDDLRWIGVIQVDTEHVHCHLAMVDAGTGTLAADGNQRGKLLDRHRSRLRRGIDDWLCEKQAVARLSSAAGYERRNVTTFVKRWAHERMHAESLPQFLLACLPADRTLWRADSPDVRMRKANRLVAELVTEQLQRPDSPMPAAMTKVVDHANRRREAESLSAEDRQRLVDRERSAITERAVDSVYQILRSLPETDLRIRTPMLDVMAMDYARLAVLAAGCPAREQGGLASAGFRLRSYASRLRHHTDRADVYRDLALQWARADRAGIAARDSRPLADFYRFEEDYHRRLMSKYRHLLPRFEDTNRWQEQLRQVDRDGQRLRSLTALRRDVSLQRMTDPEQAERTGREIYDQPGAGHLAAGEAGRALLDARIATTARLYRERLDALHAALTATGLVLRPAPGDGTPGIPARMTVEAETAHDFAEVRSLDLHHLAFDFSADVEIGSRARTIFATAAAERRRLLLAAMAYLDQSAQAAAIADLPVDDVAAMTRLSRELTARDQDGSAPGSPTLRSGIAALRTEVGRTGRTGQTGAPPLDSGLAARVHDRIDAAVAEAGATVGDAPHSPAAPGESVQA